MQLTREQWLTEISDLMLADLFLPAGADIRPEMKLKLSVGFPPGKKKAIGFALSSACSEEKYNEIFVSPTESNSMVVLSILAHEIIHAIDDCKSGHKGEFARLARGIGFIGKKLTAIDTKDVKKELSDSLYATLAGYVEMFGEIPHAKVNYSGMKRQTNRQLKVWCDCGFKFNTSRSQIENCVELNGIILCPCCSSQPMQYDI